MEGWISLHRKFINWEWYKNTNVKTVFLHLLLMANHEDKKWQGIEIKRGQRLTSIENLAKETNLSEQNIRTAIKKLKSTGEITVKVTSRYSLITIEKYDFYQPNNYNTNTQNNTQTNILLTNNQQATNKQLTTNNNDNNDNNDNNVNDIVEYYEQNIGFLNPASAELVFSYLDDLSEEMIIQAIKIASQRNKKSAKYIGGILNDWVKKGYKVLADIEKENKKDKPQDDTEKRVMEALYGTKRIN